MVQEIFNDATFVETEIDSAVRGPVDPALPTLSELEKSSPMTSTLLARLSAKGQDCDRWISTRDLAQSLISRATASNDSRKFWRLCDTKTVIDGETFTTQSSRVVAHCAVTISALAFVGVNVSFLLPWVHFEVTNLSAFGPLTYGSASVQQPSFPLVFLLLEISISCCVATMAWLVFGRSTSREIRDLRRYLVVASLLVTNGVIFGKYLKLHGDLESLRARTDTGFIVAFSSVLVANCVGTAVVLLSRSPRKSRSTVATL